ncbi:ethanolamine ammonia-lyase light chain EutC, partial [Blautia pseudococcoides]|nr:ethanolamine ammonia-lyase light chain EutC [Blautia pseudococcoides]
MRDDEIRSMVEKILDQMLNTSAAPEPKRSEVIQTTAEALKKKEIPADSGECLEDITKTDLRRQLLVKDPVDAEGYLDMKAKTPARLGIGKAGARYRTATMLRVRADHAAAQDAVFSDVSEEFIKKCGFVFVKTLCKDKDEYLTRPD